MTDIVFVRTRYFYQSYIDFWRLVELSGFPTCYVDEIDVEEHKTFIGTPMNGEWRPHIDNQADKHRNAQLISWNLERPAGSGGIEAHTASGVELIQKRHVDAIWVSDRGLAVETGFHFVVLGSDYGLGEPNDDKQFDFCHMSYVTARRFAKYKKHPKHRIGPNCWPSERDEVLKLSRFALNIHQDDHSFQEPLRFALFAAYGLPILSEFIYDAYPWSEEFMVLNSYNGIMGRLRQMLEDDYSRWRDMGLKARKRMCGEFQFKKMVEGAV